MTNGGSAEHRSEGWLKLDSAKAGILSFIADAGAYFSEEPPHVRSTAEQTKRYEVDADPLPREWATNLSHIVQDLRASLEYITQELVLKNTPTANRSRTQFPVATSAKEWKDQSRWMNGVSDAVAEFIYSRQPFIMSPDEPYRDPLCVLNVLAAVDKHRSPLLTLAVGDDIDVRFEVLKLRGNVAPAAFWGSNFRTEAHVSSPEEGWEVTNVDGVVNEMAMIQQLRFRIAFNQETGQYEGWDVIETLALIEGYLRDQIFPPLEGFLVAR
ncbi:hypothetical protein [Subtercola boreus]|nr:hypothetical protein [Subtercola boreus]